MTTSDHLAKQQGYLKQTLELLNVKRIEVTYKKAEYPLGTTDGYHYRIVPVERRFE